MYIHTHTYLYICIKKLLVKSISPQAVVAILSRRSLTPCSDSMYRKKLDKQRCPIMKSALLIRGQSI